MIKKLSKYFVLVVISLMIFIPTNVFADEPESVSLEYFNGSNITLAYTLDADKSVKRVCVDSVEIDNLNYTITENSLNFSSEYLNSLTTGNHNVIITYNDESNVSISIAVKEKVDDVEESGDLTDDVSVNSSEVVGVDVLSSEDVAKELPDYYFVSVNESDASSDVVKTDIYNSVIDSISNSESNTTSFDVSVDVGYPEDIFAVEVNITNSNDVNDTSTKNGTIIYANADNYDESDHNLVNDFVNEHDFVYKETYELVDDFSDESYSINDVNDFIADMFSDSSIDYEFNEITDSEDKNLVGNILMFVKFKYYASTKLYYKNVPFIYVPFFIEDIDTYVSAKAYEILANKYDLDGHSLSYKDGHLIDDTTGYDFGELDYIIDDSYEFSYVSGDTVYEKFSNKNLEITFDKELGYSKSLIIDEQTLENDSYNIEGNKLVIDYNFLNSLKNNNYDLVLNTSYGVASVQITIIPKQYKYIDGADSTIDKGIKKSLTVRINADVNKFVNVYLNNNVLTSNDYSIREGSTIIDISYNYLKELSNGVYKLKTIFTDGEAVTNLSISGEKFDYKITGVNNQSYEKQTNNNVSFALNDVSEIINLDINGVSISNSYYYVSGKNVIIKGSYLNNLNSGKYNVSIKFNDGSVNSYLNVKEKSSQSSSTGGSYYVPVKPYYRPTYVYTYNEFDEDNSDDVVVEEVKTEESNILEVVPDDEKTIETNNDVTKEKNKKVSNKKKTTKKKLSEKKTDSSKKGLFSIFKKKDSSTKTSEKKVNEKENNSSKNNTSKKNNNKTQKKLESSNKNNSSDDSKPILLTIDKVVNSRIFVATLIVLICGLSCYILYMVTKKDEEE